MNIKNLQPDMSTIAERQYLLPADQLAGVLQELLGSTAQQLEHITQNLLHLQRCGSALHGSQRGIVGTQALGAQLLEIAQLLMPVALVAQMLTQSQLAKEAHMPIDDDAEYRRNLDERRRAKAQLATELQKLSALLRKMRLMRQPQSDGACAAPTGEC